MRAAFLALAFVLAPVALAQAADSTAAADVFVQTDQMPVLIGGLESIRPRYPEAERRAGIEGRVYLQFVVNEDGSVSDVTVTRGVSPGLDSAAVAAVRGARFVPGRHRGQPVKVRFSLPVNFRLVGAPQEGRTLTYILTGVAAAAITVVVWLLVD